MRLHGLVMIKLLVLGKLHIVPGCFMAEIFIFFHLVKVTYLTPAPFRSVGHGHCVYTVMCSTLARLAVERDLGKSFTRLFRFEP